MGPPPPNAYPPGTAMAVGSHKAVISKYISEGGFAHVYVCEISPEFQGSSVACLKRVVVPNKAQLNILRAEVEAMKRLKGHKHIVCYIDSHAARLASPTPTQQQSHQQQQTYEVFLLMEYCSGNGLIDFMNTRLTNKLTEPEILRIMGEITTGVANTHSLSPPLIHRDIKIENVLISGDGTYKLCDFGSASPVLRPPRNADEFRILQDDILHHTTAQYRSPEMIDLYRGFPIDEKSDIWALGVFLYKLCYYTTPFEKHGDAAILQANFVFPPSPMYSERLKHVISVCLREDPRKRPNVYQLLEEVCKMRGVPMPDVGKVSAPVHPTPTTSLKQPDSKPILPKRPPHKPALLGSKNGNGLTTVSSDSSTSSGEHVDPFSSIDKSKILALPGKNNLVPQKHHIARASSPMKPDTGLYTHSPEQQPELTGKRLLSRSKTDYIEGREDLTSKSKSSTNLKGATRINIIKSIERPKSTVYSPTSSSFKERESSSTRDFSSLKSIINGISDKPDSVELSPGHNNHIDSNVDFLRDLERQDSGSSWKQRQQNTGDSMISMRKISTGSNRLKRSSISSIKQLLTGGKESKSQSSSRQTSLTMKNTGDSDSDDYYLSNYTYSNPVSSTTSPQDQVGAIMGIASSDNKKNSKRHSRTSSIQRRVHMLLNRSNDPAPVKTAQGYGKYTDSGNKESGDTFKKPIVTKTNSTTAPAPLQKTRASTSANPQTPPLSNSSTGTIKNVDSAKKAPPKKPKKPVYLRSPEKDEQQGDASPTTPNVHLSIHAHQRKFSNTSDISIVDVDDLEKDFNSRFPSAL